MGLAHALSVSSQDVPIILTDHDEEWLQRNVALNKTEIGQLPIEVTRLDWRNRNDMEVVQHMIQQRFSSSLVSDNQSEQQLMIVASDVLYNHDTHEALVYTFLQLSNVSKHTRIIIGFLEMIVVVMKHHFQLMQESGLEISTLPSQSSSILKREGTKSYE